MKALVQRVGSAKVDVDGAVCGEIGPGMLVLLCAVKGDADADLDYAVRKVSQLRIFEDEHGKMNRSLSDVAGEMLVVSQFTLAASTRKGNRPSFEQAEEPARARELYERFVRSVREQGIRVETGRFAAMMRVSLVNDGPVTVMIDSREA